MSGEVALRGFRPEDTDELAYVWREGQRSTGLSVPSEVELKGRIDRRDEAGWTLTIVEAEGRIAGFMALKLTEGVLDQLFIHPDFQGGGVGARLLALAKAAMPGGFTLGTDAANTGARRFYETWGMRLASLGVHPRRGFVVANYAWP